MYRVINPNFSYDADTADLQQEFVYHRASLCVVNDKMIAWKSEAQNRRQLIDEALSRLKSRLSQS